MAHSGTGPGISSLGTTTTLSIEECSVASPLQLGTSDGLESKFRALEGGDVEDELAALKRGTLAGARSSAPQQLPEGRPIRCADVLSLGTPCHYLHPSQGSSVERAAGAAHARNLPACTCWCM